MSEVGRASARKAWQHGIDVSSYEAVANRLGISQDSPLVEIQKEHIRLVPEMPIFMDAWEKSPKSSRERDKEEQNDA